MFSTFRHVINIWTDHLTGIKRNDDFNRNSLLICRGRQPKNIYSCEEKCLILKHFATYLHWLSVRLECTLCNTITCSCYFILWVTFIVLFAHKMYACLSSIDPSRWTDRAYLSVVIRHNDVFKCDVKSSKSLTHLD